MSSPKRDTHIEEGMVFERAVSCTARPTKRIPQWTVTRACGHKLNSIVSIPEGDYIYCGACTRRLRDKTRTPMSDT